MQMMQTRDDFQVEHWHGRSVKSCKYGRRVSLKLVSSSIPQVPQFQDSFPETCCSDFQPAHASELLLLVVLPFSGLFSGWMEF